MQPQGANFEGGQRDGIPRVLHQTWKTAAIPDAWLAYRQSWIDRHPTWRYQLWTDDDIERLIADHHPWFMSTWRDFPRHIQRVDAAKYFILYTQGGVYADLDCECLRSVEPLLAPGAVVGLTRDRVVECAFFASSPGHPLWPLVFAEMQSPPILARLFRHLPHILAFDGVHVLFTTGPRMMVRAVRRYVRQMTEGSRRLTVYPRGFLSPRSWLQRFHPPDDAGAYIRHHFSDSWLTPAEQRLTRQYTVRRLGLVALLVLASLMALVFSM